MIDFGKRIELLTDDYLIDKTENAVPLLNRPVLRGKVLGFDAPWENPGSLGMTVYEDNGKVVLCYRGYPGPGSTDTSPEQTACIAVSEDGLTFTRPTIGTVERDGSRENNILRMDQFCHNFGVFLDTNPAAKPEEKYKAVAGHYSLNGLYVFGSPDGINWHQLVEEPVITEGRFDSMNVAFWDKNAGLYRCYSRFLENGIRAIQSCTSADFLHWTAPVPNVYLETMNSKEHLYTNAANVIPGAEHMLISIPMRYNGGREKVTPEATAKGVSDCVLMTSRDGVHWSRKFREAWIAPGLNLHEWTHRNFIALSGIIQRGDDFYLYLMQNYMWEDDGIFCYSLPRYRFASVYGGYEGGSFTTKPLRFLSDTFYMNYSTAAYGDVQVTVLSEDGSVLGETGKIYGNELSRSLTFDGIAGKIGRLRFTLRDAHVYALGGKMTK